MSWNEHNKESVFYYVQRVRWMCPPNWRRVNSPLNEQHFRIDDHAVTEHHHEHEQQCAAYKHHLRGYATNLRRFVVRVVRCRGGIIVDRCRGIIPRVVARVMARMMPVYDHLLARAVRGRRATVMSTRVAATARTQRRTLVVRTRRGATERAAERIFLVPRARLRV
jgi:hypothetical protein